MSLREWKKTTFGEICTITRGASPRPIMEWVAPEGTPWVKIADATGEPGRFISQTREFIKNEGQSKSVVVHPGDLVVSNSATPGLPKFLKIEACIHDGWLLLRNFIEVIPEFIYYVVLNDRKALIGKGSGSIFTNLKTDILKSHEINLPTVPEQRRIADTLGQMDDLIAINIAKSKNLEAIAQVIFKSWFIDFDPVKAKMAGEKPAGMDAATAALFPDSLEESELGLIPKGWKVNLLGELITPKKGKTITKATCVDGEVPVVAGGLQPAYFHNKANVSQPAITVSASGANAGFVRLYLKDIWASDCSYINYEITQTVHFWYLYLLRNQEVIYGMQQGAAQPHIYPSDLMRLRLSYPSSIDSVLKFEETVAPLFLEIGVLERQNELLRIQRDSLLPRLISGELQIPEEMLAS